MIDRFNCLLVLLVLLLSPVARAECASESPTALQTKRELYAKPGQTLVFSGAESELTLQPSGKGDCERSSDTKAPPKLPRRSDGTVQLVLPNEPLSCLVYSNAKQQLTLRFEAGTCGVPAAESEEVPPGPDAANERQVVAVRNKKATSPTASIGKTQRAFIKNEDAAPLAVVCQQGETQVAGLTVGAGLQAELDLSKVDRASEATVVCSPIGLTLTLAAAQVSSVQASSGQTNAAPACDPSQLNPNARDRDYLAKVPGCGLKDGDSVTLCLDFNGNFIGEKPSLSEGTTVKVIVFARDHATGSFAVDLKFERTLVAHVVKLGKPKFANDYVPKAQASISLGAQGKLKIAFERSAGSYSTFDASTGTTRKDCSYSELTKEHVLDVAGHYHFSAGVMVTYTHLRDRTFSRQTGDDGVMRIGEQASPGVDYVLNVTAYPFGVDEERDPVAAGFLLGTSLANLGKRWYGGVELSSPIGFGLSGGVAVVIVPRLDEPLVAGQPFAGDEFPTHDAAEPTWYLGVNLQAELFKKVFGALFSSDESEGSK